MPCVWSLALPVVNWHSKQSAFAEDSFSEEQIAGALVVANSAIAQPVRVQGRVVQEFLGGTRMTRVVNLNAIYVPFVNVTQFCKRKNWLKRALWLT